MGWKYTGYSMFICSLCSSGVCSASISNKVERGKPSKPEGNDVEKRRPHGSDK